MAAAATKLPIKNEARPAPAAGAGSGIHPLTNLQRQIDRLFEDFGNGFFRAPVFGATPNLESLGQLADWADMPAIDIAETDKAYEISAELPGMDEKNIEVKLASGTLAIKGEKRQEKEEKRKDYYLSERRYGSFHRSFRLPDGVDADKVEARFNNGVLKVTLPKTAAAQKAEKKIAVKAG